MHEKLKQFLKTVIECSDEELKEIVYPFKIKHVAKNQVLLSGGDICSEFYFIVQGCIRVFFISEKGQEKTNHIALENTIISAMSSFISQVPSFENIDALEDTELLYITHSDFYHLANSNKVWQKVYTRILEHAYIAKIKRIENRVTLSAKQRLDTLMQENPTYIQRVSNQILASYLDMTQETLSRLKSK